MLTVVSLSMIGLLVFAIGMAAYTDLSSYRISNWVPLLVLAAFVPFVLANQDPIILHHHLLTALCVFAVGFLLFAKGWMAGGDVKLISAVALWSGPEYILPFLFLTSIAGAVLAVAMLGKIRDPLAMVAGRFGLVRIQGMLMGSKIPYGLAIAVGALWVAWQYFRRIA